MCHHLSDAFTPWYEDVAREHEADETESSPEPPEVDLAEPAIGATEIDQVDLSGTSLDEPELDD